LKYFIMTDLEGPAGVNRWVQTREGETPEKRAAMRLLTAEVNAAADGLFDADPDADVLVYDGHGTGGIVFEELDPRVRVIMHGAGMKLPCHLDSSFDALLFVGQHAMADTPNAPLCHTYSSRRIEFYRLNGALIGEIGCLAAIVGEMGVPTIFLAGDDRACAEASAFVPGIATVATKQGLGIELALHLPAPRACADIRAGTARAVQLLPAISPVRLPEPYELEIRVQQGASIDGYVRAGMKAIDERTVVRSGPGILPLFP